MKKILNNSLNLKNVNQQVELYGFVQEKRKMNDLLFVDLRDKSGIIQIVIQDINKQFNKESVLKINGKVVERKAKNPYLKTGEIEVIVENYEVISNALKTLPFVIKDSLEAKEETLLNYRFLDLRRNKMQKNLFLRSKLSNDLRQFLIEKDFVEIDTPLLSKSTPEGARDFLVPTRKHNSFFALPQSPQLYKQMLMASGFEKYFQFAKVFRDEDSRKDRQPEFTQLDIELSYANEQEIKDFIEKLVKEALEKNGFKIQTPFEKMDYDFAMNKYGNDHPDLRFDLQIQNFTSYFQNSDFQILKNAPVVKGLVLDEIISKKQAKMLEEIAKKNKSKGLLWVSKDSKTNVLQGKNISLIEKEINQISQSFSGDWTIFLVGDSNENTNQALGAIRVKLNELFELANDKILKFVWIENFPLFEKEENDKHFKALHHPFTSPQEAFLNSFDKDLHKAKARAYDLVLNGFEIGGGSVRINDLNIQKRMFKALGLTEEEITEQFGFFMKIFDYGLPNHLGFAFGLDRLLMILSNANSIRDVIAFPKNAKGMAVLEKAPSEVSQSQLEEYNLKIKS